MDDLATMLNKEGYETLNIPYPSFRKSLDDIVTGVSKAIPPSQKPTHFVTHSMGGIVLRCLARTSPEMMTGRIVMLAPPNQGSEIIDWLRGSLVGRTIFGPGGMDLNTRSVRESVPEFDDSLEVSVIMGNRGRIPFLSSLLDDENDGIVSVAGGRVGGMKHFDVIDADHTLIMNHREARRLILERLGHSS